jgi:hypothetical protein
MLARFPWPLLIVLAGIGQIVLAAGSLAIPRVLHWKAETARLRPLTRQVFWTYAAYIWTTNLCFGLLSSLAPCWLLDGAPLAVAVTSFISVYWTARLIVQFTYFERRDLPAGVWPRLAEACLVALFAFLALIYGGAAAFNLGATGP